MSKKHEPIAILAASGYWPKANNLDELWNNLLQGKDCLTHLSQEEMLKSGVQKAHINLPGYIPIKPMLGNYAGFDHHFFGISKKEAKLLDPSIRWLLELSTTVLEQTGYWDTRSQLQIGSFLSNGASFLSYPFYIFNDKAENFGLYSNLHHGLERDYAATKISYLLDLKGPAFTSLSACSTSLICTYNALLSLREGDCDLALAGGSNALLPIAKGYNTDIKGMFSTSGKIHSFDSSADGTIFGDGAGIVLLKRLSDAQRDNDPILAVIHEIAVNNDGAQKNSFAAPREQSITNNITRCLKKADVNASQIAYFEAHGTGTIAGDPIEFHAVEQALKTTKHKIPLGAIKANIGHCLAASGITGLIKAALVLKHQYVPPQIHFDTPNPAINLDTSPFTISPTGTKLTLKPECNLALINAEGVGGTNACVLIAPPPEQDKPEIRKRPLYPFALSAKTEAALKTNIEQILPLTSHYQSRLGDLSYSFCSSRQSLEYRYFCTAATTDELQRQLNKFTITKAEPWLTPPTTTFLFTGQGSQYANMGKTLFTTHPDFRTTIEQCSQALGSVDNMSLIDALYGDIPDFELIKHSVFTQAGIFAIEIALARLWLSWGIKPDHLIGHSFGEIAAFVIADALSLEEGITLVKARAELMMRHGIEGGMVSLSLTEAESVELIKRCGLSKKLDLAAINSPNQTVYSGQQDTITALIQFAESENIEAKALIVKHPFHSRWLQPMLEEYKKVIKGLNFLKPSIPLFSTVTGELYQETPNWDYWKSHLLQTVRYQPAIEKACEHGTQIFLEMGPHPVLSTINEAIFEHHENRPMLTLSSLNRQRKNWQHLLKNLGEWYLSGGTVNWRGFERPWLLERQRIALPPYPFERVDCWYKSKSMPNLSGQTVNRQENQLPNNLLKETGFITECISLVNGEFKVKGKINSNTSSFLLDHQIEDTIVFPMAAYIDIFVTAGNIALPNQLPLLINELKVWQPLLIESSKHIIITIDIVPQDNSFQMELKAAFMDNPEDENLYVTAKLNPDKPPLPPALEIAKSHETENQSYEKESIYDALSKGVMRFGPAFQVVKSLTIPQPGMIIIHLALSGSQTNNTHYLHPTLIDGCFHSLAFVESIMDNNLSLPKLPVSIAECYFFKKLPINVKAIVQMRSGQFTRENDALTDIDIFDEHDQLCCQLRGYRRHTIKPKVLEHFFKSHSTSLFDENKEHSPQQADTQSAIMKEKEAQSHPPVNYYIWKWKEKSIPNKTDTYKPAERFIVSFNQNEMVSSLSSQLQEHQTSTHVVLLHNEKHTDSYISHQLQPLIDGSMIKKAPIEMYLILGTHGWANDPTEQIKLSPTDIVNEGIHCFNLLAWLEKHPYADKLSIIFLTRGSRDITGCPTFCAGMGYDGLKRALAAETAYHVYAIDLDPEESLDTNACWALEHMAHSAEDEVAFRFRKRFFPRLTSFTTIETNNELVSLPNENWYLETKPKGDLKNLATFPSKNLTPLDPNEVQVQVVAAGVNFRDVLNAMDLYPGDPGPLGGEFSGIVTAIGADVQQLSIGDKVMGMASGTHASNVRADPRQLIHNPTNWSIEECAAAPTVTLTAYLALVELAKLKKGQTILIHAGAGGVGLAAIQLGLHLGLKVFATAGSERKRRFLESIGVEKVFSSRNLSFSDSLIQTLGDEQLDAILNSLTGEGFIEASLTCLRQNGIFLEIGKRNIWTTDQMTALRPDVNYHIIALDTLRKTDPDHVTRMLHALSHYFNEGHLRPLRVTSFPVERVKEAYGFIFHARQIGKVVLTNQSTQLTLTGAVLITGGFGGVALKIVESLIKQDHKTFILCSRQGANADSHILIKKLQEKGASIYEETCDVANLNDVSALRERIEKKKLTINGLIHAAGVRGDALLANISDNHLIHTSRPKINGSINLIQGLNLTPNTMAFVVFISSQATYLGGIGNAAYAFANSYLEGYAANLRRQGFPAITMSWGMIAEIGMAAKDWKQLLPTGSHALMPEQIPIAFKHALHSPFKQTLISRIEWTQRLSAHPLQSTNLYESLLDSPLNLPLPKVTEEMTAITSVTTLAREVMELEPNDPLVPDEALSKQGFDSMSMIELRNLLAKQDPRLKAMPMEHFQSNITLQQLTAKISEQVPDFTLVKESLKQSKYQQDTLPSSSANTETSPNNPDNTAQTIITQLTALAREVMELEPNDPLDPNEALSKQGFDSMSMIELRNALAKEHTQVKSIAMSHFSPNMTLKEITNCIEQVISVAGHSSKKVNIDDLQQHSHESITSASSPIQHQNKQVLAASGIILDLNKKPISKIKLPIPMASFLWWLLVENSDKWINYTIEIEGPLELFLLTQSINQVFQRHDAFKLSFNANEPYFTYNASTPVPFIHLHGEQGLTLQEATALVHNISKRNICDLSAFGDGPLAKVDIIRQSSKRHFLIIACSHLIADMPAIVLLFKEILKRYNTLLSGKKPDLPSPQSYVQYCLALLPKSKEPFGYSVI